MSEENKNLETVEETVNEEAKVQNTAEEMPQPPQEDVVEELKEETISELNSMTEEDNQDNKRVLDDAKEKIDSIFKDLSDRVQNADADSIKEGMNNAKEEVLKVLNSAKEKVTEASDNENFKNTVNAGKDFLTGAGGMIGDAFQVASDKLMENDNVKNFVESADGKLDEIRENENLRKAVERAEDFTEKLSSTIFGYIKDFLDQDEKPKKEEAVEEPADQAENSVEQVDSNEENNNL